MSIKEEDRILKVKQGDTEVEVYIKEPSVENKREAHRVYLKAWREALDDGNYLQSQLYEKLKDKGLWDDEKQSKLTKLEASIKEHEEALRKGGISLNKAKEMAIKLKTLRFERRFMLAGQIGYLNRSCEGIADQAQFEFLVSKCTVYNEDRKKTYFKSYDDYISREDDDDVMEVSAKFAHLYYGTIESESALVENKFLTKYGFANEKFQLTNKEGHRVDSEGRLLDEDGRYIAYREDGSKYYVNVDGKEVDENGDLVVDFSPFLDDETGKPIEEKPSKGV